MVSLVPEFISSLVGRSMGHDLVVFLASFIVLMWAASMLVVSLRKIANYLRLSNYVIAFILMGFVTSIPELFIGISSALNKIPIYSFGNLIGANIANLGLVLGVAALLAKNLKVTKKIAKQELAWCEMANNNGNESYKQKRYYKCEHCGYYHLTSKEN